MAAIKRWIKSASIFTDEQTGELLVRLGGSVEVKRAKIDAASAAAAGNVLVPAAVGKKSCVLGICLIAAEAVNAVFFSGAADTGTALSGPLPLAANGGFVVNPPADPRMCWLETAEGQALTLGLDTAVQCSGWIVYYEG